MEVIYIKHNICLVTFSGNRASSIPVSNITKIVSKNADIVFLITMFIVPSNLIQNVKVMKINHKGSSKIFARIVNYLYAQIQVLSFIFKITDKTNIFLFFIGGEGLVLPFLALKLLGKKIILMLAGNMVKEHFLKNDVFSPLVFLLNKFNFTLADTLLVYSHSMIHQANLEKYQNKILTIHEHSIDFNRFNIKTEISKRPNTVGYLGRLSAEKGVLNFIKSIPLVLKNKSNTNFVICGEGLLKNGLLRIIETEKLHENVKLFEWIKHEDVPKYLNQLKLLVVPSFSEGLPNVVLEAMACGVPVLATPVGAIPDIIRDDETGFLLESNSPLHIAEKIIDLLSKPVLLEQVSTNAHEWVYANFSEETTLDIWRKIITRLNKKY